MKKVFISFLIMTLTLTSISLVNIASVQAATTDSAIEVSLENIRDIMIENSLDIKVLDNNLKIAKEQYENAKGDLEDAEEELDDAEEELEDAEDSNDDLTDLENKEEKAELALIAAKDNLKSARSKYEQGVEAKIYVAQEQYITYLSNLSDEKLKEDTVKAKEKEVQVSKLKYENGFMSKNDYISSSQSNTNSTNELKKLKADVALARTKLCNTLGISPEENIIFKTDITKDFKEISEINFNDDLIQMLSNNIDIKLKNDEIDDLDDKEDDDSDIHDYKVDTAENELKQLINNTETTFKGQYNTLIDSYNSIKSNYDEIIQEQAKYQITQTKYDYGFISQKEVDTGKLTLDTNIAKFIKDRNACYLKYLKYIEMKEGY